MEKDEWEDVIVSRERMEMWLEEGKERIPSCSSSFVIDEWRFQMANREANIMEMENKLTTNWIFS